MVLIFVGICLQCYLLTIERFVNIRILSQLYWNHVNVIETYSGNRFVWRADECVLEKISATTKWNRIVFESYHYLVEMKY